jgi:hypothetical protein
LEKNNDVMTAEYFPKESSELCAVKKFWRQESIGIKILSQEHKTYMARLETMVARVGFDRIYGFLGGDEEGYHLSVDLVDKAILFISNHESAMAGDTPFKWYKQYTSQWDSKNSRGHMHVKNRSHSITAEIENPFGKWMV